MQLLTLEQVLKLHQRVIEQSGGAMGVRNQEGLESAWAQFCSCVGLRLTPNPTYGTATLGGVFRPTRLNCPKITGETDHEHYYL